MMGVIVNTTGGMEQEILAAVLYVALNSRA